MASYTTPSGDPLVATVAVNTDGGAIGIKDTSDGQDVHVIQARSYVWDTGSLGWVKGTQGGGGGGGGAVTIVDGGSVTLGAISDVAVVGDNSGTASAKLRGINKALAGTLTVAGPSGTLPVSIAAHVTVDQGTAAAYSAPWTVGISVGNAQIDPRSIRALTSSDVVTLAAGSAVIGHVINDASSAVIGHIIADTGSTTAVTGNVTVIQGTGSNLHAVLDAGSAVIGHIIADSGSTTVVTGNVTVVQGTGTNLHAVLDAGTAVIGHVIADASSAVIGHIIADSGSTTVVTGNVTVVQATPASLLATVTQLTLTKGSQGATGVSTQDLKDAGRSQIMLSWEEMAGTAAAESALTNFTLGSKAAAALSAASSYTVTAAKTLRIQSVTIYIKSTGTAAILARYRIRQAASSIANNSPVIFDALMGMPSVTFASGEMDQLTIPIPDGLEVAAGQQITFTWFTSANTCTVGMSITGFEY